MLHQEVPANKENPLCAAEEQRSPEWNVVIFCNGNVCGWKSWRTTTSGLRSLCVFLCWQNSFLRHLPVIIIISYWRRDRGSGMITKELLLLFKYQSSMCGCCFCCRHQMSSSSSWPLELVLVELCLVTRRAFLLESSANVLIERGTALPPRSTDSHFFSFIPKAAQHFC